MSSCFIKVCLLFVQAFILLPSPPTVRGMTASPEPYQQRLPDGAMSDLIYLHGNEEFHWISDKDGYPIVERNGWFEYARVDPDNENHWLSTGGRCGAADPVKLGLVKGELPKIARGGDFMHGGFKIKGLHQSPATTRNGDRERRRVLEVPEKLLCSGSGMVGSPCRLTTLVVLVQFADHLERLLPLREDYLDLFNSMEATKSSPTGSVRGGFFEMAYQTYDLEAYVTDWIPVSRTELESNDGFFGINKGSRQDWLEALHTLSAQDFDFSDYDFDDDNVVDMIAFLHSGVGAEIGGIDCEHPAGHNHTVRIWSHKSEFPAPPSLNGDVIAKNYYVASGVWSACPPEGSFTEWGIARRGVIMHETAHVFGLPDLNDGSGGNGVASHCLMGGAWGWSASQLNPSHLGAWSKYKLGWSHVTHVLESSTIVLGPACIDPEILLITHEMVPNEYFLIENRHGCGMDVEYGEGKVTRGGVAIWHIDESEPEADQWLGPDDDSITYKTDAVCQDSMCFDHYKVAVVQADGRWDLEKGASFGDEGDLFKKGVRFGEVAYKIDNSGIYLNNGTLLPEPNTKSYAKGFERPTGISIEVKTAGAPDYTEVRIELTDVAPYTAYPTSSPTAPSPFPTFEGPSAVPITFIIQFDNYPQDIGFEFLDSNDASLYGLPSGTWEQKDMARENITFSLSLHSNNIYELRIHDSYGDGLGSNSGYFAVYYGDEVEEEMVILKDDSFTSGSSRSHKFLVEPMPQASSSSPTSSLPSEPSASTSPQPSTPQPTTATPSTLTPANEFGIRKCADTDPCDECEGDCKDNDAKCVGLLVCMKRDGNEPVPGCIVGSAKHGRDYCYNPEKEV